MAKDPAFLFYPGDYISGTMGMTFEEKGAYIELLMLQFNRGHMTKHMIGQTVGQMWDKIEDKFLVDADGRYYNERLELEQKKRKAYTRSRLNNKLGKNQHSKKRGHMTPHMEDINEDIDNSIIKGHILNLRIWFEPIFMKRKIEPDDGINFLTMFLEKQDDLVGEGKGLNRNIDDIQNHFVSWLDIAIKRAKDSGSNLTKTLSEEFSHLTG